MNGTKICHIGTGHGCKHDRGALHYARKGVSDYPLQSLELSMRLKQHFSKCPCAWTGPCLQHNARMCTMHWLLPFRLGPSTRFPTPKTTPDPQQYCYTQFTTSLPSFTFEAATSSASSSPAHSAPLPTAAAAVALAVAFERFLRARLRKEICCTSRSASCPFFMSSDRSRSSFSRCRAPSPDRAAFSGRPFHLR